MQPIHGHTTPETAFLVEDYPYGFRLRCRIRYWLEYKAGNGFRFASQTTNPKVSGEVWNKPKYLTYSPVSAALFLNEEGHVKWAGLHSWATAEEAEKFAALYELDGIALQSCNNHTHDMRIYETKKAAKMLVAA